MNSTPAFSLQNKRKCGTIPPIKVQEIAMNIRKATVKDLNGIVSIYDEIHEREENGETTTGWLKKIYPVRKTAEESIARRDMFVQEDASGAITATGIINAAWSLRRAFLNGTETRESICSPCRTPGSSIWRRFTPSGAESPAIAS